MADRSYSSTAGDAAEDVNPLEGVTFTLDKIEFACKGRLGLLELSDLALLETQAQSDQRSAAASAATAAFLRTALGDDEYARFRAHTAAHRTPATVILAVLDGINEEMAARMEAATNRPTAPSSGSAPSPPGQEGRISRALSLATGDVTVIEGDHPPAEVMAAHRKRRAAGA